MSEVKILKELPKLSKEVSISNYLDVDYKEYSKFVMENRAIPSVSDGFKPTQRKIFEAARLYFKKTNSALKVISLAGEVMAKMAYNSGEASLCEAIIGMAQDFKNSLPLFDKVGQFGSMRDTESGAPRYVSVKPSSYFSLVFKDQELVNYELEDTKSIPQNFLPILPMVLLNGGSGLAIGFSTKILNRNPLDVIKNCKLYLNNKEISNLRPFWHNFTGEITKIKNEDNKEAVTWLVCGKFEIIEGGIKITELPPSVSFDDIEDRLQKLISLGLVESYTNLSSINLNISIYCNTEDVEKILNKLKFRERITENFTTLDEGRKILIFKNDVDVLKYFVDWRLPFYEKRLELLISNMKDLILKYENQLKFIELISKGEIKLNSKLSKNDLIKTLEKNKFDFVDTSYDYLTELPIHWVSSERKIKIEDELNVCLLQLAEFKTKNKIDLYLSDLNQIEKELKKYFL